MKYKVFFLRYVQSTPDLFGNVVPVDGTDVLKPVIINDFLKRKELSFINPRNGKIYYRHYGIMPQGGLAVIDVGGVEGGKCNFLEKSICNLKISCIFAQNMNYDISESVSQRSSGEETAENRGIHEIADELRRRCQLYETQLRDSQGDVNHLDVEQRVAEQYAKEKSIWLPICDVFDLGVPGPSGNENDTYVSNDIIYKVNNLLNAGSILCLLDRIMWHNNLFYDTAYTLHGFTGFDGRTVMPVLQQRLVKDAVPATTIEIETYMAAIGFTKQNDEGKYANAEYEVWDLVPRNVLRDKDGDVFIIDAEIAKI